MSILGWFGFDKCKGGLFGLSTLFTSNFEVISTTLMMKRKRKDERRDFLPSVPSPVKNRNRIERLTIESIGYLLAIL